jgi:hypothetical protein
LLSNETSLNNREHFLVFDARKKIFLAFIDAFAKGSSL